MAFEIQDGTGGTKKLKISSKNEAYTLAQVRPLQHTASHEYGRSFQIQTVNAAITNTKNNILMFKNLSQTYDIIITTLKAQNITLAGGTALPSINSYIAMYKNPVRSGGGEATTAENINFSSANVSNIQAYKNGFSLSDEGIEIDRLYLKEDGGIYSEDKQGSIIIGPNNSIGISLITDHTSGFALCQINYIELEKE